MGITQVAYAELGVADVTEAVGFHTDVLGMVVIDREGDSVMLGCGVDRSCDLTLSPGGSGVRRFGLAVEAIEDLQYYGKRLADAGVAQSTRTDQDPGVVRSLRFEAPTGHTIELVEPESGPAYLHPARASHKAGIRPLDFDHITLQTTNAAALMDFLVEVLEFKVSDVFAPSPGVVGAAWCRAGDLHHDVAIVASGEREKSLHHYALGMESFDDLKVAADILAYHGVPIETGPGRHGVGGNVYTYFWVAGNRYELSAEMPRVRAGEPVMWSTFEQAFSPWGLTPPESFATSS